MPQRLLSLCSLASDHSTLPNLQPPAIMLTLVKFLIWAVAFLAAKAFEQYPAPARRGHSPLGAGPHAKPQSHAMP